MQIFHVVAGVALLVAIAFQVWLTVRVFRSNLFERDQKMNQAKLIWLLPVIGAAIVFSVLIQEDEALRQSKPKSHLRD